VFKNTSIAMTIGVAELTFQSYQIDADTFHGLEATTGAMLIYLLLGMAVVKFMDLVEPSTRYPACWGDSPCLTS
jgi:ABC-type amino acid transport system permease subunit